MCDILGIMEFEQCPWKRNLHLGFEVGTRVRTLNVTNLEEEEWASQIGQVKPSVLTVHSSEVPGGTERDSGPLRWRGDRNPSVYVNLRNLFLLQDFPCSRA